MVLALPHMITAGIGRLRRPGFDARAAVELARFGLPFFPATRYALAPSALLTVLNDIVINRRQMVLELGSGYSSVYIAKALPADGVVVTVDAHEGWLAQVKEKAAAAGVADKVMPVHAPTTPVVMTSVPGGEGTWYDLDAIKNAIGERMIDLLLVDGPVASEKTVRYAREPAVPLLKDFLSPSCAVFLDDIHRPSHAQIAKRWGAALGVTFVCHHARGGFAYAARGDGFDPVI